MGTARHPAALAAERTARVSYGRLLSVLAARTRDIALAEDALADAFAAAVAQWPRDGVPANPEGWLITVARRSIGRQAARGSVGDRAAEFLTMLEEERAGLAANPLRDERLALLFVCTHPAIDRDVQAPLMLQTVLGLDANRIAAAFLVAGPAMGQRLVRAKRKIRDAGIAFTVPDPAEMASRIGGVLAAIYAAYGTAWDDVLGADATLVGLCDETVFLVRLLADLLPDEPEVLGLQALILHCEARRAARRDAAGVFVPLHSQDPSKWSGPLILEAERALRHAATRNAPGRYQTEAAIQSLHAHQRMTGERFAKPLARLYDILAHQAPTLGVLVARAVAHAEAGEAAAALHQLDALPDTRTYQPWWAAMARVAWLAGEPDRSAKAAGIAAGLSADPAIRHFLLSGGYAH